MRALALAALSLFAVACGSGGSVTYNTNANGSASGSGGSLGSGVGAVASSTSGAVAATTTTTIGTTTSGSTVATTTNGSGSGSTGGSLYQSQACVVYASSDTDLYEVNPADAGAPPLHLCAFGGALSSSDTVTDIAVIDQGTLYAITETALYTVDTMTCIATLVATLSTTGTKYVCLGFTFNGILVGADETGNVYTISTGANGTAAGTVTTVGTFGSGMECSGDIEAVNAGTELTAPTIFATAAPVSGTWTTDTLVTLDPTTYAATSIGPIGFKEVFGLAYWGGQLYGFTHAGQTLQIDPGTGVGTVLYTGPTTYDYSGGATTPIAPQNPHWE